MNLHPAWNVEAANRHQQAVRDLAADAALLAERGVILHGTVGYLPEAFKRDYRLAMDAQPQLSTDPNSAIPVMLTTYIDPDAVRIAFSPTMAAKVLGGDIKKGTWLDDTAMFPVVESAGEVSSYGDYNNNGTTEVNFDYPNRQSYLFQTIKQYGERELERVGLMRLSLVTEKDTAAAETLNRFSNLTYFYGVSGLQNYGLFNAPGLSASLTPATKANGGVTWFTGGGSPNATPNEVYNDILATWEQLVLQCGGVVQKDDDLVLAMSPGLEVALDFANSFNVTTTDLLKKNFKNLEIVTAVQYGVQSSSNPQGVVAGNYMQLIARKFNGKQTGFCAFNEKMRSHPIIRDLSSFKQKVTAGTWGAVVRQPVAFASMLGM